MSRCIAIASLLLSSASCAMEALPAEDEEAVDASVRLAASLSMKALRTPEDTTMGRKYTISIARVPAAVGVAAATSDSVGARCDAEGCYVRPDSTVTAFAVAAEGYTFLRWTGCGTTSSAIRTLEHIRADAICQPMFERTRVPITFTGSSLGYGRELGGSSVCTGPAPCTVPYGATLKIEGVQTSARARFLGWAGCSTSTSTVAEIGPVYAAQTCTPRFAQRWHVGLASTGDGTATARDAPPRSTCSSTECVVDAGGSVRLYAIAREGSELVRWSGDGCPASTSPSRVLAPTRDMTCRAEFAPLRELIVVLDPFVAWPPEVWLSLWAEGVGTCTEASCFVSRNARIKVQAHNLPPYYYLDELRCNGVRVAGGSGGVVDRLTMEVGDDAFQNCWARLNTWSPDN
jgi:Divergent InlB B-repeat domain